MCPAAQAYKKYRALIIDKYREDPKRRLTFDAVRPLLDAGSVEY